MSKLELIKSTYQKLSTDNNFIAYYLQHFTTAGNSDLAALGLRLDCSEEALYRLGLCKAPSPVNSDFAARVLKIAEYTGVDYNELAFVLRSVYGVDERPYLQIRLPYISGFVSEIGKRLSKRAVLLNGIFSNLLPSRLRLLTIRTGQVSLSAALCVLFVLNFTNLGKSQNVKKFYNTEYSAYKDSITFICLEDITEVTLPLKNL